MRAEVFDNINALPETYRRMLAAVGEKNIFHGLDWYTTLLANTSDPGDQVRIYGVMSDRETEGALALFVGRVRGSKKSAFAGTSLEAFSNFFSLEAGPIFSPLVEQEEDIEQVMNCLIGAICEETPRYDTIRIGPLNNPSVYYDILVKCLQRHRMDVAPFFQHKNWHQNLIDCSFEDYIRSLGKSAKEAVRKSRKLDREHDVEWVITDSTDGLERALETYQKIYAESWKEPEIYPRFIPELIRSCARDRSLRLGNLYVDGEPTATQLVIMSGKNAVMFKTAYVPGHSSYSSGTVVMVRMMRHIISVDQAQRIDFGAGDEPYKSQWSLQCRERWGLMAYNRATARGSLASLAMRTRKFAAPLQRKWRGK